MQVALLAPLFRVLLYEDKRYFANLASAKILSGKSSKLDGLFRGTSTKCKQWREREREGEVVDRTSHVESHAESLMTIIDLMIDDREIFR